MTHCSEDLAADSIMAEIVVWGFPSMALLGAVFGDEFHGIMHHRRILI